MCATRCRATSECAQLAERVQAVISSGYASHPRRCADDMARWYDSPGIPMADLRISQRAASDAPLMERNLPLVPGLHPPALFWAPRPRWIPGLYAPSLLMVMEWEHRRVHRGPLPFGVSQQVGGHRPESRPGLEFSRARPVRAGSWSPGSSTSA
ncbi:hypothetical protein VTN00DRAFT_908 [Thermoascus crustaceus]|uniref:uncharacterized protein n=1 Tax=Thermoascus crustaceus TaxID=5088 RepID=UPI0037432986